MLTNENHSILSLQSPLLDFNRAAVPQLQIIYVTIHDRPSYESEFRSQNLKRIFLKRGFESQLRVCFLTHFV
jgi:hypothetical protein